MATKPTKQQIAYAKARAGGNTTSKTTPARMLKGAKDVALFAAGIVGPGKTVKTLGKVAKVVKTESRAVGYKPSVLRKDPIKKKPATSVSKVKDYIPSDIRSLANELENKRVASIKSGESARLNAKRMENWNKFNPGGKKPTIKINSNPYKGK